MKTAIIIGAGPAGLTAALELLRRTDISPIVLEQSEYMGGISRTVNYKGNRIEAPDTLVRQATKRVAVTRRPTPGKERTSSTSRCFDVS